MVPPTGRAAPTAASTAPFLAARGALVSQHERAQTGRRKIARTAKAVVRVASSAQLRSGAADRVIRAASRNPDRLDLAQPLKLNVTATFGPGCCYAERSSRASVLLLVERAAQEALGPSLRLPAGGGEGGAKPRGAVRRFYG
jgi:hypothetical protein